MSESNSKVCRQCGSTDFNNSGNCRPCQKARSAKYYALNTEKVLQQSEAWYVNNREIALQKAAEWSAANPEKVKAIKEKWLRENPEKRKQAYTAYVANNPEKAKESSLKYRAASKDKARARAKAYKEANRDEIRARLARRYRENPEKFRARNDAWMRAHPEVARVKTENRRARKIAAGGQMSRDLALRLYAQQGGKCACCGEPLNGKYHMDHIMPLVLGGSNSDDNIQLLTPRCNMEKGAMHPEEFKRLRASQRHQEG